MEFNSILDLKKVPESEGGRPAFFLDLNLNQVIDRICALWEKNVSSYYYYLPADKASEDYRRAVFADICSGDTYEILCEFVGEMSKWEEARGKRETVRSSLQKSAWFLTEAAAYCGAFYRLHERLQSIDLTSEGMRSFRKYLSGYLASTVFMELQETGNRLQEALSGFVLRFSYENERMSVEVNPATQERMTQESKTGEYDTFLQSAFPGLKRTMKSPFEIAIDHSELEQEIVKVLQKLQPDFYKKSKKFYDMFSEYGDEKLLQFADEIAFYLSFRRFELSMGEQGYLFAAPKREETKMQAVALYDLALACAKGKRRMGGGGNVETGLSDDNVVANDMSYLPGERFFVLTGPNQGGKTTFARSLGQLVYFAKMGLHVPAKSATVPYFSDILTHFSVEESVETGRGKLKEELVRLEPMMERTHENAFVIINELFTTAANYDACIMGKRVLQHFLEQKCQGIYVTHLKELAEPQPGIVSIRAMLDGQGRQNFEIRRSPAVESANASNQVNKYRLTYEQLKERLK